MKIEMTYLGWQEVATAVQFVLENVALDDVARDELKAFIAKVEPIIAGDDT